MLLQTYVRAVHAASSASSRPPAYMREDWVQPNDGEREERIANLRRRFPAAPLDAVADALHRTRGHAGYAVTLLRRWQPPDSGPPLVSP